MQNDTEQWLKERLNYIGGSDIAAVMGMSRWKTPFAIWAEKTGKIASKDLSDKEYIEWGHRLEAVIADKFAETNNVKLIAYKKRYFHKEYPYMSCELDRLVAGTDELVEIKTCSTYKAKEWGEEEIPDEYLLQVVWYLGITGRNIGHLAVLIGGQQYIQKKITFDQELFDKMVEAAKNFWENNVKNDIPPVVTHDDTETLLEIYPGEENDELLSATEEMETAIKLRQELSMHIEEMKKDKKKIEVQLKEVIGNNMGILTPTYKVTWKEQTRSSVDTEKLKESGLYAEYSNETSTRVLRVSLNK